MALGDELFEAEAGQLGELADLQRRYDALQARHDALLKRLADDGLAEEIAIKRDKVLTREEVLTRGEAICNYRKALRGEEVEGE